MELPRWGEVVGVRMDVEHGMPVLYTFMLPGARRGFAIRWVHAKNLFFVLIAEDSSKISLDPEELILMLSRRNVDISLHGAILNNAQNVRILYNWFLKVVRNGSYLWRLFLVDMPREQVTEHGISCVPDDKGKEEFGNFLKELEKTYPEALEGFREVDDGSLKLYMLGPSYLVPDRQ